MPVKKKKHPPVEILWTAYHNALYHFRASRFGTPPAEIRRFPNSRLLSSESSQINNEMATHGSSVPTERWNGRGSGRVRSIAIVDRKNPA